MNADLYFCCFEEIYGRMFRANKLKARHDNYQNNDESRLLVAKKKIHSPGITLQIKKREKDAKQTSYCL